MAVTQPRYARFHKCDLQLQTPADHEHWEGLTKLSGSPAPEEQAEAVTAFVDRCYEVGLEVIGITDHNLGGPGGPAFLDAVRAEVKAQAGSRGRRITVFPGFEIKAKHVSGVHFLCLFEPRRTAGEVSDVLTRLGLPVHDRSNDRKADCDLDKLLDIVGEERGIVIAAHVDARNGVLDDKKLAEQWQADVIRNERLICIELTKTREHFAKMPSKLGMIVRNDPNQAFHRTHPIAVVNSSDNKRLGPDDGNSNANFIGSRDTWIKMSTPSIEGLRQAFLDHESRITFGPNRPEDTASHPRIERITISGARFLDDQEIDLSPNLNTFIGGGGTGKSTILEYVRAVTGQPPTTGDDVRRNHQQAIGSLGLGTVLLQVRRGNDVLDLTYPQGAEGVFAPADARFPIVALSQREAFAVASSTTATLELLDRLQHERMAELRRSEQRASEQLAELDLALSRLDGLRVDHVRVSAELDRLRAMLGSTEERRQPLAILNQHRRENDAVANLDRALLDVADQIDFFAEELSVGVGQSGFRQPDTPHADAVAALLERIQQAVGTATTKIGSLADDLRQLAEAEGSSSERRAWDADLKAAEASYTELLAADPELVGEDPERIRRLVAARTAELGELNTAIRALEVRLPRQPELEAALRQVWDEQVQARQDMAARLRSLSALTAEGTPYVEVTIRPDDDIQPLCEELTGWMDKRSVGTDLIHRLCEAAREAFPPAERVDGLTWWIDEMRTDECIPELEPLGLSEKNREHITMAIDANKRRDLLRLRLPDVAEVRLRRKDGSLAGTLSQGLSVGQKCTAILALALAAGTDPILIDQPEDEIDNEFIYTELVPLLRKAKNGRQIIITTHNPNLPVNGDAELIYALQAVSPPGGEARGSKLVEGSLDQPKVREAVERIMEGSREAFDRRRAKYGY